MDGIVALRPFVPARDYELSRRFYTAIGFTEVHADRGVTVFSAGGSSFILQNFNAEALAANTMVQLMVRDVAAWWGSLDMAGLEARFGVKAPIAPTLQHWGLIVGFIFDPSGVLWHVAEMPT